jgi:hypothetical protein
MQVDQLGHPCCDQQARPDSSTTGLHAGSARRWRRSAATVAMSISPVQADLIMPVVLVCDRRVRGTRVLLAVILALR